MRVSLSVLVVDDSAFFRNRIADVLRGAPDIRVVGFAVDGEEAVRKAHTLRPDVITMDIQMPCMDGITAVQRIMAECPSRILMFSAYTREGARETLAALEAGAIDFMSKERTSLGDQMTASMERSQFLERIRAVGQSRLPRRQVGMSARGGVSLTGAQTSPSSHRQTAVLVIGASTGGPVALQNILCGLPRHFPLPLAVAVHMPGSFTTAYAERLNSLCAIDVREASDHEPLHPGLVLVAPGGRQMLVEKGTSGPVVRVRNALPGDIYHPSVDQLFSSASRSFGPEVLALVLTGMGADGLRGARQLKSAGGLLWSQNEKSCVVYGMPHAVEQAGLSDRVLPLDEISTELVKFL